MANEFKKGQYNISLPDVTKNSTLLTEDKVESYKQESAVLTLSGVQIAVSSVLREIDLSNSTELEIFVSGISTSVANTSLMFCDSNTHASSPFLKLTIKKPNLQSYGLFFHAKFRRVSLSTQTWTMMCFSNYCHSGRDNMTTEYTSNPSFSQPLLGLNYFVKTINLSQNTLYTFYYKGLSQASCSINLTYTKI